MFYNQNINRKTECKKSQELPPTMMIRQGEGTIPQGTKIQDLNRWRGVVESTKSLLGSKWWKKNFNNTLELLARKEQCVHIFKFTKSHYGILFKKK